MSGRPPRARVICDNDYSGDPDGLVQLAHHLLSSSVEIRAVIGSHLAPGDPFEPSKVSADNAAKRAGEVVEALGMSGVVRVLAGSNLALADQRFPQRSPGALTIVEEAMREDTDLPLYVACGAGLTEIASAYLLEPAIAERLVLVWIGGPEYPGTAPPPPGASRVEYNLQIDIPAARVVFNDSALRLWHVPRNLYRQCLLSEEELQRRVRPRGAIGRLLWRRIEQVQEMAARAGLPLGETYIYGDSPLVLLTALQSSFHAEPSSSPWRERPAPRIREDGTVDFSFAGRTIRVFESLDVRLMFEDLFAKLEGLADEPCP